MLRHKIIKLLTLGILFFCALLLGASAQSMDGGNAHGKYYKITGNVTSREGPIPFAYVSIEEPSVNVMTDAYGHFEFTRMPAGTYKIVTQCHGYVDAKKIVTVGNADVNVDIKLRESAYELEEVTVMAKQAQRNKLEVNETAIEYVQPVSLSDVMILLPGNLYQQNALTDFSLNTNRQAGSDQNTSLGIGLSSDGVPQTSDGIRTQMVGMVYDRGDDYKERNESSNYDGKIKERSSTNSGSDLRYVSTDHIHSIEYTKGISSPRYGNLSSGLIKINSKSGVSPLRVRTKVDLMNKLVYAGKGFKLGEKAGTLYAGVDYLHAVDDIRDEMDKFTRITAQTYYNNKFKFGDDYSLDLDAKVAQTISANKMKKDELTYEYNETYKADYDKTDLMLKGKLNLGKAWIDNVEWINSLNRVDDRIDRHYCVITANPKSMPKSYEEGEHEGYYLPTMYYSDYYVENTPINFYTQLNLNSRLSFNQKWNLNLEYGADFHSSKNKGDGAAMANPEYPPFPSDNTYMRPRANWSIPALEVLGAYLQAILTFKPSPNQSVKLEVGGRLTEMLNLPDDYVLNHKMLSEPRVNFSYLFGKKFKSNVRFGYGEENKLPTLDYLYPEKMYKDFWVLNAYTNNPEYRHLITYTQIYDATNKKLRENKNQKIEVGYDASYKSFEVSVTAFHEFSNTGFEYFRFYAPVTYPYYNQLREDADISGKKPDKEDYVASTFSEFALYRQVMNSKKIVKNGIEYRLIFPKIKAIQTNVEVNGAYYKTTYGTNQPDYFYPNSRVGDSKYPYVGLYDLDCKNIKQQFNTNFWFNTHIPKFRLIFTNFFQLVWFQTEQKTDNYEGIYKKTPYAYVDFEGNTHVVTEAERRKINSKEETQWFQLLRQSATSMYETEKKPIYLLWNIKATKELNDVVKLSFFVNGILDVHPKYINDQKSKTNREWSNPYFGMEMVMTLGKTKNSEAK